MKNRIGHGNNEAKDEYFGIYRLILGCILKSEIIKHLDPEGFYGRSPFFAPQR